MNPRCCCSPLSSVGCCRLLSATATEHLPPAQPATSSSRFLRACLPGRSSLCVCFVAHTRGDGGIRSAEAPGIGDGNPRKILFLTQRLSKNHKLVYCPEGTIKYTNVNYDKWFVRPRTQLSVTRVRADAHTRTHARKSASHRWPSIAAHVRVGGPRSPAATSRTTASSREVEARSHAWPDLASARRFVLSRSRRRHR